MSTIFEINIILHSGKEVLFKDIILGNSYKEEKDGITLSVGVSFPAPVEVTPSDKNDPVKSIEYNLYTDIKNYHQVIVPDTGREYINSLQLISFWNFNSGSTINSVNMPIYIFKGQDMNTSMAFGIVGENYETDFKTLEPKTLRALIAFMRRLSIQIKRGTDIYPIPDSISKKNPDGVITEYLYYRKYNNKKREPWLLTLRDFSDYQKKIYHLPDFTTKASMYPLWCSWTDWFSDDVTEEVILENVKQGVKLGIKNYIIDDGWFGPGLDNDIDIKLNIGDWRPDPKKIKDMKKLVAEIKKEGAKSIIWCAPHAVAEGAECFKQRKKHLIMDEKGELLLTGNKFHSLCFMDPEARKIMADICAGFITEWDFDGAKYDLFNCVQNIKCKNPEHEHDVTSMVEGLNLTLKLIDNKCRALKKDYIVELKQNYGTPFLARWGTMVRAGDTPYNNEGNFVRTIYIQSYTPYSMNDYQTITNEDTPEDAAVIILKMMAAGIPAYSIDFTRLNDKNKEVLAYYNNWYNENIEIFMNYRVSLDAENNILKIPVEEKDYYFLINEGGNFEIKKSSVILNATFKREIFIKSNSNKTGELKMFNCFGNKVNNKKIELQEWAYIEAIPGCMIEISV